MQNKQAILGMDLGGSNLFSVAYDAETSKILLEKKVDTEARKGYTHVIKKIADQILWFENQLNTIEYSLNSIGLGIPGIIDKHTNIIKIAPNLGWKDIAILEDLPLEKEIKNKIIVMNDVNAGLYGELQEIKEKPEIAVAIFCGTGIGGAIAIHGEIIIGADGTAGEIGHMIIKKKGKKCLCGNKGCLEAYIGKWALNSKIQRYFIKGNKSILKSLIDYDLSKAPVKSSTLRIAYEKGDNFTKKLLEKYYSFHLSIGILQIVNFLNPDVFILGGGIMEEMGEILLPFIKKYLRKYSLIKEPKIYLAKLGDYSGPLGAAYYAYHFFNKK